MILDRNGNKKAIAKHIIKFFPKHDLFIDLFFGAGGLFFCKPKAKYNIVNDLDNDVYNLFRQVVDNKEELLEAFIYTPISETLFKEWQKGKRENTDILNAVRFLFLSNFSFYGAGDTLRFGMIDRKKYIKQRIDDCFKFLQDVQIMNADYTKVISKIFIRNKDKDTKRTLIYADPPYVNTSHHYNTDKWGVDDFSNLLDMLVDSKMNFAVSEFNNEIVVEEARKRNLYVIPVLRRKTINNRNTEILITNYKVNSLFI